MVKLAFGSDDTMLWECSQCGALMTEESMDHHHKWHVDLNKDVSTGAFNKIEAVDHYLRFEEAKACAKVVEEMHDWAVEYGEQYLKRPDIVVPRAMWEAVITRVAQELWERADFHSRV